MGNNNATISITLDQVQPIIYYSGDIISGKVQCTVSESIPTTDDIHLIVNGTVGYITMHKNRMQNGQTNQVVDRHDICILRQKVRLGQMIFVPHHQVKHGPTDLTTFEPGLYTYPFSILLPDLLPPTLHPKDYPFVRYQLELLVEKKWYVANTYLHYPLRIYPRVNLRHVNNSHSSVKFDTRRHDVIIKGVLQHSALVPGETTIITLDILNPLHLLIKRIDICLIQRYDIAQQRRRLEIMRVPIPQLVNFNAQHVETACPFTIPIGISPSYRFEGRDNRCDVYVYVNYDIRFEVKAKGLFSDFELQIPVMIGTHSDSHSNNIHNTITSVLPTPLDLNAIDKLELKTADDDEQTSSLS
ncbi:hypothetical protein I4U23_021182 [Adineta vaga]|nr:hypothetical protein I4U23_021182 [Adineta vaga]